MKRQWYKPLTLLFLFSLVLFRLYRAFIGADIAVLGPDGNMDLHSYWDPAQAVLRGIDPYPAVISGVWNTTKLGIIDIAATSRELLNAPASAPVALMLLSPFAFLKWTVAKIVWSVLNVLFATLIPFVFFAAFKIRLSRWAQISLALLFLTMSGPAITIQLGNLGLICILCCLLAVWLAPRNFFIAGVLLGISISKFTLTAPLLVFFMIFGYWRVALIALIAQILGLIGLSFATATPVVTLFNEYLRVALPHYRQIGELNVQSRVFQLKLPDAIGFGIAFIGWVATILSIVIWRIKITNKQKPYLFDIQSMAAFGLFVFLQMAALPFVYHRLYDSISIFFLVAIIVFTFRRAKNRSWFKILGILCALIIANFLYPRFLVSNLPASLSNTLPFVDTGITILAWAMTGCFLFISINLDTDLPTNTERDKNNAHQADWSVEALGR